MRFFFFFATCWTWVTISAQNTESMLPGRWKVLVYSEQGVQVDKRLDPLPQAKTVYNHIRQKRVEAWQGPGDQDSKAFRKWEKRDSTEEVRRIIKAITMPYYLVFYEDGAVSLYNQDASSRRVYNAKNYKFQLSSTGKSISFFEKSPSKVIWMAEIVTLTKTQMVLFLPASSERVELEKIDFMRP